MGRGEVDYRSSNVAEVVEGFLGRLEHKVATNCICGHLN